MAGCSITMGLEDKRWEALRVPEKLWCITVQASAQEQQHDREAHTTLGNMHRDTNHTTKRQDEH